MREILTSKQAAKKGRPNPKKKERKKHRSDFTSERFGAREWDFDC
jgi:hypothetical protein